MPMQNEECRMKNEELRMPMQNEECRMKNPIENIKVETYCRRIANGEDKVKVYKELAKKPKMKASSARGSISKWRKKYPVDERILFLQKQSATEDTLKRQEKRGLLAEIARDGGLKIRDRLAAIKLDNLMSGDNAPKEDSGDVIVKIVNFSQSGGGELRMKN
jgi:hypothetical protein